jgi:phosphoribosylformylglycinamidine cyclo-ligase
MITYEDSGVNIEAADIAIRNLSPRIESTFIDGVLGHLGGFSSFFDLGAGDNIFGTILATTTDGVGTKLKIAFLTGIHNTVGIDLVAMNVNDIIVSGSKPILFMDYFSTSQLDPQVFELVLEGICRGCKEAGCALVGGETAEMPGFYNEGEYDLAGFCVGLADSSHVINGSDTRIGDSVIGIASSGLHSNGYSLVRKLFLDGNADNLQRYYPELGKTLGQELLTPTRIYVKPVLGVTKTLRKQIKAMAHITGGGFIGNIPRVIPEKFAVKISLGTWTVPPIFSLIEQKSGLGTEEMFKTFNMGIGFVIVCDPGVEASVKALLHNYGLESWTIGEIIRNTEKRIVIE